MKELGQRRNEPETRRYLGQLFLAFFLTAAGGLALKMLGDFHLQEKAQPVAYAILVGGILMLIIERVLKGRDLRPDLTWVAAGAIGLSQLAAAVFPGTSRSGATILVALAFGLRRPLATEFSFLLGVPTLLAAGALEVYSAYKNGTLGNENWSMVLLGSAVATITAFIAVRWLLRYVQSHTFDAFGWYRVVFGIVLLLVLR
jgi:undecaprenyl-diphosphatase